MDIEPSYLITCSCGKTTTVSPIGGVYTANKSGWIQREFPYINANNKRIAEGWNCGQHEHMIYKIKDIGFKS